MSYKFPWTNYHELNLDWILNTVKELFAKTEQNNAIVEQYDGRLTEVELTADNAQTAAEQAQQNSTAALDLAQNAAQTATQAQQAAGQAQQAAGQAQQAAGQAQQAAGQAQQTATQAQQTAQNFDGRITQAENDAEEALQAAQAFDEQVQGAITAANNANTAATTALTTATETARELAAQRSTLEGIVSDGVDSLQEAAQDATEEIEAAGQSVLDSIPADYTTLSELVDKKADVIYNTAAGDIASFNDGADDMKIKSLIVNIEPVQAGSGNPSPDNVRPIYGYTSTQIVQRGKNLLDFRTKAAGTDAGVAYTNNGGVITVNGTASGYSYYQSLTFILPAGTYIVNGRPIGSAANLIVYNANTNSVIASPSGGSEANFTLSEATPVYVRIAIGNATASNEIYRPMIRFSSDIDGTFAPYTSNKISVDWEDEAGTVYGGSYEVIGGALTNDMYIIDLSTITNWSYNTSWQVWYKQVNYGLKGYAGSVKAEAITEQYPVKSLDSLIADKTLGFGVGSGGDHLYVNNGSSTMPPSGRAVAKLASPVEYQLTPQQQVKTLYQYNNIWSDAGSVNVEYPADTKTYIDNKFAELQALILEH